MDREGSLNGRRVSEGEIIGKVATWGDYEKGTSYHIHFNIQVFTKIGWVWVNPYMTLVAAYERLIGGRGSEIMPGAAGAACSRQAAGDLASRTGAGTSAAAHRNHSQNRKFRRPSTASRKGITKRARAAASA